MDIDPLSLKTWGNSKLNCFIIFHNLVQVKYVKRREKLYHIKLKIYESMKFFQTGIDAERAILHFLQSNWIRTSFPALPSVLERMWHRLWVGSSAGKVFYRKRSSDEGANPDF